MSSNEWNIQNEIDDVRSDLRHAVILGAGASVAAMPKGDKNGRQLPTMDNFIEVVGLSPVLKKFGIVCQNENFESLYSDLVSDSKYTNVAHEIEECVRDYFSGLVLPDHPTIYDHLVLSLREKDLVATFNWDPFLLQACSRNFRFAKPPRIAFLHGCVAQGLDSENKIVGPVGKVSSKGKVFEPTRILFPIKKKDYKSDPLVSAEWNVLKSQMKTAYVFTIFGYGAPASDVEAVALMKESWGDSARREFEEIEIIDVKDEEVLTKNWESFIHTHHYQNWKSFYESTIATHPRRSCEATWNRLMKAKWVIPNPLPLDASFKDLYAWMKPLIEAEN